MATTYLAPDPIQSTQLIPGGAVPANGGQLFFYLAGTSTKSTVYKDNAAAVAHTNPIVLDSGGNIPSGGEVWFASGVTYKVVFAPATDTDPPVSPYWTKDNLAGMNDVSATASEWISGTTPTFVSTKSFTLVGRGGLLFLSNLFWIALATLAATHCLFSYTVFGRHLLATGSNPEAARLSGINTRNMIVAANVLSGFYAALAAVLWVSRMGSAQPATGKDWLISSFAIAIVGGTGLSGGSISSLGILTGAIIIVLIKNGLVMLDANVYFEQSFLGSIILAAVVLNRARELWTKK